MSPGVVAGVLKSSRRSKRGMYLFVRRSLLSRRVEINEFFERMHFPSRNFGPNDVKAFYNAVGVKVAR